VGAATSRHLSSWPMDLGLVPAKTSVSGNAVPQHCQREEVVGVIIYHSIHLRCDVRRAFEMFTVNEQVQSWLAPSANIEAEEGGSYELFWDLENREHDSTTGCRVTAIEQDRFLSFEWKGPRQFEQFMNDADPLTHVVVFLVPYEEGSADSTEVHLIHSGWRSSPEWEEARQWFERVWSGALEELERQVNGRASNE
jgi:uncharacterized protein YndB with AHSA1/START domain